MERTLLLVVALEAFVGRFLVKGIELPPGRFGAPRPPAPPVWFVALDYLALFLLYFATALALFTLAVGRIASYRGARAASAPLRVGEYVVGVFTVALLMAALGGVFNHSGPPWILLMALLGIALYAVIAPWLARADLTTAIGVAVVAAPVVLYALLALLTSRLWTEEEIFDGAARASFGAKVAVALTLAAMLSPYVLAPRPLVRSLGKMVPLVSAIAVSGLGVMMLVLNYPSTIEAINRTLGLTLVPRSAITPVTIGWFKVSWIHICLLALATVVWTIVSCLVASSAARQRVGVGLGLLVTAGLGFAWPMNYAVVAVGLLALADAAPAVAAEERRATGVATPAIDDESWLGFVGAVVARLRADGPDANAVSVRGEHGQISTMVVTERHGVPLRMTITRVTGAVISVDLVCGRESARAPTWTAVARGYGAHPEPPPIEPRFALDDARFDQMFRCAGDRAGFSRAVEGAALTALATDVDGWLAGWDGEAVRHRVFPGIGAPIDHLLPLTELAARRAADPIAVARLIGRIELCAQIAARLGVVAATPTDDPEGEAA